MPKGTPVSFSPSKQAKRQKKEESSELISIPVHLEHKSEIDADADDRFSQGSRCNGIPPDFHWWQLRSPGRILWGQTISTAQENDIIYPYLLFKVWIEPIIYVLGLHHVSTEIFWSQCPSFIKDGWNRLADDRRYLHQELGVCDYCSYGLSIADCPIYADSECFTSQLEKRLSWSNRKHGLALVLRGVERLRNCGHPPSASQVHSSN
jgi:hypothetical protein